MYVNFYCLIKLVKMYFMSIPWYSAFIVKIRMKKLQVFKDRKVDLFFIHENIAADLIIK